MTGIGKQAKVLTDADDRVMFKAFMASLIQVQGKAFAARVDISQQYLCDLRKGRRQWCPDTLDRVMDALDITRDGRVAVHRHCARTAGWKI